MTGFGRGYNDIVQLQKISGSGPLANGTKITIPASRLSPWDPENKTYPPVMNNALSQSVFINGQRVVALTLDTLAKDSWLSVAQASSLLQSLITARDANGDSDLFALKKWGDITETYDGVRCIAMNVSHNADGGGIPMTFGFLAIDPAGTTDFGTKPAADGGQMLDATSIDFGAVAGAAEELAFSLALASAGRPVYYGENRSRYPSKVMSGMVGGSLTLTQTSGSPTVPSTTLPIRFFAPGGSTPLFTITVSLSKDSRLIESVPAFETQRSTYTLCNTTGALAVTIS